MDCARNECSQIHHQNTKSQMRKKINDHKAHLWKNLMTSFVYQFDELITNYNDVADMILPKLSVRYFADCRKATLVLLGFGFLDTQMQDSFRSFALSDGSIVSRILLLHCSYRQWRCSDPVKAPYHSAVVSAKLQNGVG